MTPFSAPSTHTHTSVLYWSKGSPCKQWCSLSLCVFCHANLSMFLYTAGGALRHTLSRSHTHRHTHTQTHAHTHTHAHTYMNMIHTKTHAMNTYISSPPLSSSKTNKRLEYTARSEARSVGRE